jgi:hypothetical protein
MSVSTDPKVLMGLAKCVSCLNPHQQLQAQTYLFAKIGGFDTSVTGVRSLVTLSDCFKCATTQELIRMKQYLLEVWLGLDTSIAGIRTQVRTLACFDCLTPVQQITIQTYLLALSAGAGTDVAGVRAIEVAAKCFDCPETKRLYEIQVYILSILSGSSATSPSDILNAAKCFVACLPPALEEHLLSSLVTQTASRLTPPCVTPTAPTLAGLTNSVTDGTILQASWKQLGTNSGSLITGYTVFWGTVSGVYTNQSALLPVIPKQYLITGLTPGTLYFVVVKANSTAAVGCSSVSSNERSNTTGGVVSNGLLNSLISYWKFDANTAPTTADSFGSNPLTMSGASSGIVPGIINSGLDVGNGASSASHVSNADFLPVAGTSLSVSFWISASSWASGGSFTSLMNKGDNAVLNSYNAIIDVPTSKIIISVEDTSLVQFFVSITPGLPTANVFHHVVLVFDATAKTLTGFYDGVNKGTVATNTNAIAVGAQPFYFGPGAGFSSLANCVTDEAALWHKALTQTDVTNLFNGGAALPLSSFQA